MVDAITTGRQQKLFFLLFLHKILKVTEPINISHARH